MIIDVLRIYPLPNFYKSEETTVKASIPCKLVNVFIIHIRKYLSPDRNGRAQQENGQPALYSYNRIPLSNKMQEIKELLHAIIGINSHRYGMREARHKRVYTSDSSQ